MPHRNKIIDSDAHFVVNSITRQIENKTPSKITLMQNDHNSERFTFTLPRYIEGHDMLEVSKAEVHYLNGETAGIYEMKDVAIDAKDESKVTCSWLLSSNATQNAGSLQFQLKFTCLAEDGITVDYAWHSAIFNGISISKGINNTEIVAENNVDILEQWKKGFIQKEEKNVAGGVAGLDENGKLFASVIPEGSTNIFEGLTASFYGDSLTEVNGHYTKGYHFWIKEMLGLKNYNNYGVSGYKISDVYNKVKNITDTSDIIFIMCGVNDQTFNVPLGVMGDITTNTTYGSLNLLCSRLKEKYPTKLIVFITPHYQTNYLHNEGITSYEITKAIKEVCEKYTIPVYDNYNLSGIYSSNLANYTTDNCHWNDIAHEMVGKNIATFMRNTFGYIYGITLDNDVEDGAKCYRITSCMSANQLHISLYVDAQTLPVIPGGSTLEYGFTIKRLDGASVNVSSTVGVFDAKTVNDLHQGYKDYYGAISSVVDNGDGSYTCANTMSFSTDTSNINGYWLLPCNTELNINDVFYLSNPYVKIGSTNYEICAIGGAFESEVLEEI